MILKEVSNITGDCLMSINSTCLQIYSSMAMYVSLYTVAAAIVLFTVCGNLLVIIAVYHFKQLHTPTNVLIMSLAISDCLVGLFVMPVHSMILIESCSLFGSSFCALYNTINFQLTSVSVYNISLIAVDRYLALSNPFVYSKKVSLFVAFIVVLHMWIISFIYNCALLYFNGNFQSKCPGKCVIYVNDAWTTVDLMVVFICPCATIIILYLKVFLIARRHAVLIRAAQQDRKRLDVHHHHHNTSKSSSNGSSRGYSVRLESKAARVLGILVSVFLVCLIPYYICMMLTDVLAQSYDRVVNTLLTLFFLNSMVNPVIYALFYPWFKKSVKLIVTLAICRLDSSFTNVLSCD